MSTDITPEELAQLAATHGRIKHVRYNGVDLVFRKPKRCEVQDHAAKLGDKLQQPVADDQLAQVLVVHPSREAFLGLLEEFPYMTRCEEVGGAIMRLTGLVQDETLKR